MHQTAITMASLLLVLNDPIATETPAPEQVLRLIGGLMSEVHDLSLVYEGHKRFLGPRSARPEGL